MSSVLSWTQSLRDMLTPQPDGRPPRTAVIGVGQPLRGDDGVGPAFVGRLSALLPDDESLLLLDAGHAPENCLGIAIRFRPEIILFVDAAAGGGEPGDCLWLRPDEADGRGGSTHTLSLELLATYLSAETGATAHVLGIEPGHMRFDAGLSPAVAAAADIAAATFASYWRRLTTVRSAIASADSPVVNT